MTGKSRWGIVILFSASFDIYWLWRVFTFLHSSMDWARKAWRCETEQKVSR